MDEFQSGRSSSLVISGSCQAALWARLRAERGCKKKKKRAKLGTHCLQSWDHQSLTEEKTSRRKEEKEDPGPAKGGILLLGKAKLCPWDAVEIPLGTEIPLDSLIAWLSPGAEPAWLGPRLWEMLQHPKTSSLPCAQLTAAASRNITPPRMEAGSCPYCFYLSFPYYF